MRSELELWFAAQLRDAGLTEGMEEEYEFEPGRRWRLDFAWPGQLVAVEIEGGVWSRGRHTRGSGFIGDCEKYNTAVFRRRWDTMYDAPYAWADNPLVVVTRFRVIEHG